MTDDELMKALREAASAERDAEMMPDVPHPSPGPHPRLDRLTDLAMAELQQSRSQPTAQRLRSLPKRRFLASTAAAMSLAVAATFLLLRRPEGRALPMYRAEIVAGAEQSTRGETAATALVFRPGTPFELTLRPQTRVEPPLEVRAYLVQQERAEPLGVESEVGPGGTVHLRGRLPDVLANGAASLAVVVARPGELPTPPEVAHGQGASATRSRVIEVEIRGPAP